MKIRCLWMATVMVLACTSSWSQGTVVCPKAGLGLYAFVSAENGGSAAPRMDQRAAAATGKTSSLEPVIAASIPVSDRQGERISITFDVSPYLNEGRMLFLNQWTESGMLFTPMGSVCTEPTACPILIRTGGGVEISDPVNGSPFIQTTYNGTPPPWTLQFRALDGSPFDLLSVDLAEPSVLMNRPTSITFRGIRADGRVVSATFTTDGIINGTGTTVDFETFCFSDEFRDLLGVEVPSVTYGYSLDNVVLAKIPEPSTCVLLATGMSFLGWLLRRQARSSSRADFEAMMPSVCIQPDNSPITRLSLEYPVNAP